MSDLGTILTTGLTLGVAYALVGAAVATVATSARTLHLAIGPVLVAGTIVALALRAAVAGPAGVVLGVAAALAVSVLLSLTCELVFARTDDPFVRVVGVVVVAGLTSAAAARTLGAVTVRPDPVLGLAVGGLPLGVVDALALAVPAIVVLHLARARTPWGHRLQLVGGSAEAARRAGTSPGLVRAGALVASGVAALAAGLLVAPVTAIGLGSGPGLSVRAVAVGAVGVRGPWAVLPAALVLGTVEAIGQGVAPSVGGDLATVGLIVVVAVVRGPEARRAWGRLW